MKTTAKKLTLAATVAACALLAVCLGTSTIFAQAADTSANGRFYTDYTSTDQILAAGRELNEELASEGVTLLKNDGTLPLNSGARVSVLGLAQDCMSETDGSITESLADAGFKVNPTLKELYDNDNASKSDFGKETVLSSQQKQSIRAYNDAAIVVIARGTAGESSDRSLDTGEKEDENYLDGSQGWSHEAGNTDKHELELTASEQNMIALAEETCKKVIVLYSSSNVFEMGNLNKDSKINAIAWIGRLGDGGISAVGRILSGKLNPSGKTVDEWTNDFTNDPTYANTFGSKYTGTSYIGLDYEEDIYLGYKYYETYRYEASQGNALSVGSALSGVTYDESDDSARADAWYRNNVVYPFGYGLSYTDFSITLDSLKDNFGKAVGASISSADVETSSKDDLKTAITSMTAEVTVKNTGDFAGKEVVEIYVTAPYESGDAEKSYVTLVGYGKTDTLRPGGEETLDITFNVQDFASYSTDANGGNGAYLLDSGDYTVHVMESSSYLNMKEDNKAYASATFNLDEDAELRVDDFSGNQISNEFSNDDDFNSRLVSDLAGTMETTLSRSDFDGTKPSALLDDLDLDSSGISTLSSTIAKYQYVDGDIIDDSQYVWCKTEEDIPSDWTQGSGTVGKDGTYDITLDDMAGVDLYDAKGNISSDWVEFINQLTWDEIASLLNNGSHLTVAVPTIGKMKTLDDNGPNYSYNLTTWVGEPTVAATWNTDLAARYGYLAGNTLLAQGLSGWYGPGMNIHRSAFSGRSPEYYSQDAIQGGFIAAAVVKGATETGINVYVKHFALYDVSGLSGSGGVNATEQNIRENYLKIFQMAMQEGDAHAAMSAFNRIGAVYAGQNYALIQGITRGEWGWNGFIITDIYSGMPSMTVDGLVRAGAEIPDGNLTFSTYSTTDAGGNKISGSKALSGTWDSSVARVYEGQGENSGDLTVYGGVVVGSDNAYSPTQWYCARMAVTRLLYNEANSAGNNNGVTDTSMKVALNGTQGTYMNELVIPEKYVSEDAGYSFFSELVSGSLPTGLTFDNGYISGTPLSEGGYDIVLNVLIDGWVKIELDLTINIDPIVTVGADRVTGESISSLTVGDSVNAYVEYDTAATSYNSSYTMSIVDGALPAGLEMNGNGRITGTAATTGTYTFTVAVDAVDETNHVFTDAGLAMYDSFESIFGSTDPNVLYIMVSAMGMDASVYFDVASETFYMTYTITVSGASEEGPAASATVESIYADADGNLVITLTDGTVETITIASSGSDSAGGVTITTDASGSTVISDGTTSVTIPSASSAGSSVTLAKDSDGSVTITDGTNSVTIPAGTGTGADETTGSGSGNGIAVAGLVIAIVAVVAAAAGIVIVLLRKKS
ncbi:MAG: glycoside hydrolase family 3 C-terminal domain-containing protein [Clostridia bacterium]|nr:glycoside hydrolase family 3 C-terminal domain-containing protein [Clostridia bacterium]